MWRRLVACLACFLPVCVASATDWLQFDYDTAHSGFNRAETGYSTPDGNAILYHYALPTVLGSHSPGTVDGAPVYVGDVATASGTKNILLGLRNDGTLLALDADSPTLNVLWSQKPGGSGTTTWGIGAPAIDPGLKYVYAYGFDGKIHKYQVADGTEVVTGGWPEVSTLKPEVEKEAAGLSIAKANGSTYLYAVTDGYVGDANDYQGHLTAINLGTGAQKVFNSLCSNKTMHFCNSAAASCVAATNDCSDARSGIWGRPGAVYDAGTNRVFITTGNGAYNASVAAGYNWGDSILALNPDGSGSATAGVPVDSYTPATYQTLDNQDLDLGSVSIAILPAPPGAAAQYAHLGLQGGKDGSMRLLNLANLTGYNAPRHLAGELQTIANPRGGMNLPQPAVWVNPADSSTWVFVASFFTVAYEVVLDGTGKPSLSQQWSSAGGSSPIVANGTVYYAADDGHLRAVDAVTGVQVNSTGSSWATSTDVTPHWQSPIIVNGRVYLFDNANPSQLWVFQLDGILKNGFD